MPTYVLFAVSGDEGDETFHPFYEVESKRVAVELLELLRKDQSPGGGFRKDKLIWLKEAWLPPHLRLEVRQDLEVLQHLGSSPWRRHAHDRLTPISRRLLQYRVLAQGLHPPLRDEMEAAKKRGAKQHPSYGQSSNAGPEAESSGGESLSMRRKVTADDAIPVNWKEARTSDFRRFTPRDILDLIYDYRQLIEDLRAEDKFRRGILYTDLIRAEMFLGMACIQQGLDDKPIRDMGKLIACELGEQGVLEAAERAAELNEDPVFVRGWAVAKVRITSDWADCVERLETAYRLAESMEEAPTRTSPTGNPGQSCAIRRLDKEPFIPIVAPAPTPVGAPPRPRAKRGRKPGTYKTDWKLDKRTDALWRQGYKKGTWTTAKECAERMPADRKEEIARAIDRSTVEDIAGYIEDARHRERTRRNRRRGKARTNPGQVT
jgi:hypothetical protein